MTDHTPWPWSVGDGRAYRDQKDSIIIASVGDAAFPMALAECYDIPYGPKEKAANAHLMAAAPDLLLALKELLADVEAITTLEPGDVGLRQLRRAHAAIAKAKGVS